MHTGLVTLTTDFGTADGFVGVMKGVILAIAPEARIIDLCHGVARGDVRHGAFVLLSAVEHFPEGTVHVGVVDPGVGTDRRVLCLRAGSQLFVGPDNGLFSWAAARLGLTDVFHVTRTDLFAPKVSATFHGRDVFAPVAAHLLTGVTPEQLGPRVTDMVELPFPQVSRAADGSLSGRVLHVDGFGNLITNITEELLGDLDRATLEVRARGRVIRGLTATYADVRAGELTALIGSAGFLELAVNGGRACRTTQLIVGDVVTVSCGGNR